MKIRQGVTHPDASGFFELPWVRQPGLLNNKFYKDLRDQNGRGQWRSLLASDTKDIYAWQVTGQRQPHIMFNSDMCLWYDIDSYITDSETGECSVDALDSVSARNDTTKS